MASLRTVDPRARTVGTEAESHEEGEGTPRLDLSLCANLLRSQSRLLDYAEQRANTERMPEWVRTELRNTGKRLLRVAEFLDGGPLPC